jgi:hypothetical protein
MDTPETPEPVKPMAAPTVWQERYGDKHRWRQFVAFPASIAPPRKVRIYQRAGHFLLNSWDPGAKKNLSERGDRDLLMALTRARAIDERVTTVRTAGVGRPAGRPRGPSRRCLADLGRRADAEEVDPKTVRRYNGAVQHYTVFTGQPYVVKRYPTAGTVDEAKSRFAGSLVSVLSRDRV